MPFVPVGLLRRLVRHFERRRQAIFIANEAGVGFPFLIPVQCLKRVERQLRAKRYSLQALAAVVDAAILKWPAESTGLMNVNTPEDWAEARRLWRIIQSRRQIR
jgi:molybdopterin-guanine dinucleotide biosynthesis protein A